MNEVILKNARAIFHKTLLKLKSLRRANLSGKKACHEVNMQHRKLKTLTTICFASKVIMFQETLCECYQHL
jgi:hypothetical protein